MINIPEYEGLYKIDLQGNVWSCKYERMMKPRINNMGYACIQLYKDKQCRSQFIHRLLAKAFIPNPDSLPQINHIDGNPLNNQINNLEWCTQSYNAKHAYDVLGHVSPWKGKKRPEIKQWFTPYEKGNIPWNVGSKATQYIPRKRIVYEDPICPLCFIWKRVNKGRYPDGKTKYLTMCNNCRLFKALHGKGSK